MPRKQLPNGNARVSGSASRWSSSSHSGAESPAKAASPTLSGHWDVVIIGAGAAGLMCASTAGYRGRRVLLIEHAKQAGRKILMSGGGRCNFTNMDAGPQHYFSANPHFCISALKRYTPADFVELTERHQIDAVEKAPGQLFCRDSARPIVDMLLTECEWAGVHLALSTQVNEVKSRASGGFELTTSRGSLTAASLVVASGGLSVPSMGATGFGYALARQFGLKIQPTRPALVPFTLTSDWKAFFAPLSGVAVPVNVRCNNVSYREPLLITHRGVSGPAILKASTHWLPGDAITIDWLNGLDVVATLKALRQQQPRATLMRWLAEYLPKRLSQVLGEWAGPHAEVAPTRPCAEWSNAQIEALAARLTRFSLKPAGTEGWRTAEVTYGGVDTEALSSRDMSVNEVPGLYFIGEVVDVTGQLGGYNFQWAWSSAVACANAV